MLEYWRAQLFFCVRRVHGRCDYTNPHTGPMGRWYIGAMKDEAHHAKYGKRLKFPLFISAFFLLAFIVLTVHDLPPFWEKRDDPGGTGKLVKHLGTMLGALFVGVVFLWVGWDRRESAVHRKQLLQAHGATGYPSETVFVIGLPKPFFRRSGNNFPPLFCFVSH